MAADLHLEPDPRRIEQSDQDQVPHQSEKKDSDPHQSEKRDPDPHLSLDPQHCLSFVSRRKKKMSVEELERIRGTLDQKIKERISPFLSKL